VTAPIPTSGALDGNAHHFPIRVYYEDTDAGGVVYHANFLRYAERARSELMRVIGWPYGKLKQAGFAWVVRRIAADYRRPARLDDALVVTTTLIALKGASIDALQVISRGADELVRLTLQLVLLTDDGKPARLPPSLRQILLPLLAASESAADPCQSIP
jgi:acyl-CoA thioester hydrolase